MQLTDAFNGIIKQLEKTNEELGFKISEKTDNSVAFKGDRGIYRMVYDDKNTILSFDCAYEEGENGTEFNTVSRTLLILTISTTGILKVPQMRHATRLSNFSTLGKRLISTRLKCLRLFQEVRLKTVS